MVPIGQQNELEKSRSEVDVAMNVFEELTGIMGSAAELLGNYRHHAKNVRKQAKYVQKKAEHVARDFRNEAAVGSERLGKAMRKRLQPDSSGGNGTLQFLIGVGIGVGAAFLLAPLSGKQMREKLRSTLSFTASEASSAD